MTATEYNANAFGKLWHVEQLPGDLRAAWSAGPAPFATAVAALQKRLGIDADGKLGPGTLARVLKTAAPAPTVQGFDVSGYQNPDHFDLAKMAGMSFAYVKATQENHAANADAQWQFDSFHGKGLAVGFYHFGDVSEDAVKQADVFCARCVEIAGTRPTLPPCLDLEWYKDHNAKPDADFRAWTSAFLGRVRDNVGRVPVLYVGVNFWKEHLGKPLLLNTHLWVVDYSHPESEPTLPPGFTAWTFRQYSGSGTVPFYRGPLDLDVFNGTDAELRGLVA